MGRVWVTDKARELGSSIKKPSPNPTCCHFYPPVALVTPSWHVFPTRGKISQHAKNFDFGRLFTPNPSPS